MPCCYFFSHVLSGRYDLRVPVLCCNQCNKTWSPEARDFIRSGYWPATCMQGQTLFQKDVFHSFEAMKTSAPAMSRQAFTALLDQRTVHFGRVSNWFDNVIGQLYNEFLFHYIMYFFQTGKVSADSFQRSFLQYKYCTFLENQLLGKELFVCPACCPDSVAVAVDGNRKLYRFQRENQ